MRNVLNVLLVMILAMGLVAASTLHAARGALRR